MTIELNSDEPVLIIQIRAMGDMLLTTPLIREFKRKYPNNPIDVLAQPLPAQVLQNSPHVHHIFTDLKSKPLRKQKYRLAIDFLSTPGSAFISRLSGARYRIGYRLRWRSLWYTHPVERRVEPIYNPLTKFDLVKGLGVLPNDSLKPDLFILNKDRVWARERFNELNLNKSERIIGLAPWSKREWRRWSFTAWIELLNKICAERPTKYILYASEHERAELQCLLDAQPNGTANSIVWAGADHILHVAALMERCKVLIGADNGLKHIAVASKVPTITVYTGSQPEVWNPPNDPNHIAIDIQTDPNNPHHIDQILSKQMELVS